MVESNGNPNKAKAAATARQRRHHPARKELRVHLKARVLEMRLHMTHRQIAAALNISPTHSCNLCNEAMEDSLVMSDSLANRIRAEQLAKLEEIEARLMSRLLDKNLRVKETKADGSTMELADFEALIKLTGAVVKLQDHVAKLVGCYAPEKVQQSNQRVLNAEVLGQWLYERNCRGTVVGESERESSGEEPR